jgi:hypothetical protein
MPIDYQKGLNLAGQQNVQQLYQSWSASSRHVVFPSLEKFTQGFALGQEYQRRTK